MTSPETNDLGELRRAVAAGRKSLLADALANTNRCSCGSPVPAHIKGYVAGRFDTKSMKRALTMKRMEELGDGLAEWMLGFRHGRGRDTRRGTTP